MSIQHNTRVIYKGIWRDLKIFFRYKAHLIGLTIESITAIIGYAIMAGAYYFNPEIFTYVGLDKSDFFLFMITGSLIQVSAFAATWGPLFRVEEDVHFGTIEAIFVTPCSSYSYLMATSIARSIFSFIIYFPAFAIILGISGAFTNPIIILYVLLIILLNNLTNLSVGMFFGMITLLRRQSRFLVRVTHQLIQWLFGAYLPIQGFMIVSREFGLAMKYFALAFPFTYIFDLLRYFTLGENYIPLIPIWQEFLILGVFIIVYFFVARFILVFVEKKAKERGLALL
ncbi:MAG: ABC transporter permease [Candidatus Heimdallarchaeota archaeon]|nr:ABC transporter permease [Candidatus Heimdallarchaeota archaeon]